MIEAIYLIYKKIVYILQSESFKDFLDKVVRVFTRKKLSRAQRSPDGLPLPEAFTSEIVSVPFYLEKLFPNTSRIPTLQSADQGLRLNLLIDTLYPAQCVGRRAIALIFATVLSNRLDCPLRILTRDNDFVHRKGFFDLLSHQGVQRPSHCEFMHFPHGSRQRPPASLPVTRQDVFIATGWETAMAIKNINLRKQYMHILQNDEKVDYPQGDAHFLIDEILNDAQSLPIVSSPLLYAYLKSQGCQTIRDRALFFEPAFPYIPMPPQSDQALTVTVETARTARLLFSADPEKAGDLFYTGLSLIDHAICLGLLDTKRWTVSLTRSSQQPIQFSDKTRPKSVKPANVASHLAWLSAIDLFIHLKSTPCPDHLPLEAAAAGAVVLTQAYPNTPSLDHYSKNILCAEPHQAALLKQLEKAVLLSQDKPRRSQNLHQSCIPRHWGHTLSDVMEELVCRIANDAL